jgi:hypothetical protein
MPPSVVRLNQRLSVDPFLGLKKSKRSFRTQVAPYFQWPWTRPGVQMESHCYFHNSFDINTYLIVCPLFGTRDELHIRPIGLPDQTLKALRVRENLAPLLGQGGERRSKLVLPGPTDL